MRNFQKGIALASCLVMFSCGTEDDLDPVDAPDSANIRLEQVASGLSSPVYLTAPAGDTRLFVVEQTGRIRIIANGQIQTTPFLDVSPKITMGGERGLLSVAFHPNYSSNGFLYVNYTNLSGHTIIERYTVSAANRNAADPASAKLILRIDQPFANHNGGLNVFGPDGMLYIGMGDGGSGGDPQGNGQKQFTLLGKMLRIDVDRGDPYAIPVDNPLINRPGVSPEIWATGLRNPWRFSFDRTAGLLIIADVGQNQWEEINVVSSPAKPVNYGWNLMEGKHCFQSGCSTNGLTQPVLEYSHANGRCSVTGGYVYRGTAIPGIVGHYFFADYCEAIVRSFRPVGTDALDQREYSLGDLGNVTSFGEDAARELYLLSSNGRVYKIVPAT